MWPFLDLKKKTNLYKESFVKIYRKHLNLRLFFFLYNSLWLNIMSKILMVILMVNLLSMPIQCPQRKKCQKKQRKTNGRWLYSTNTISKCTNYLYMLLCMQDTNIGLFMINIFDLRRYLVFPSPKMYMYMELNGHRWYFIVTPLFTYPFEFIQSWD